MIHNRLVVAALLLLSIGALLFRTHDLGNRPMHGDEAVHAFKFRELWEKGIYRYDPNEFHGPTIYYAALPAVWLQHRHDFASTQEKDYRLPIAIFGAVMVLLVILLKEGMGESAVIWSALFLAISPAYVFYSRYYIQEILLAFFTLGMIGCGWRYARSKKGIWLITSSICAGLMIASKETAVLTFVASAGGLWLSALWTAKVDKYSPRVALLWQNRKLLSISILIGLLAACFFLSGFLTNLHGPVDYLRSYTPWLHRAHGTDIHRHPWYYYLLILLWTHQKGAAVWSEGLILGLGAVGAVFSLLPKKKSQIEGSSFLGRYLTFTTLILTVSYSVIPYKTPWCVLSFLLGFILLAGIGAASVIRCTPSLIGKSIIIVFLLLGCVQLAFQSYRTSFIAFADPGNPYVYAQTVPDIEELQKRLDLLAAASPQRNKMVVKVFSVDNYYWPLPWNLRRFPNIGYWNGVPKALDAPVILASPEFDEELTHKLDATHLMTGYFGIRSGVFLEAWVRLDLWKSYLDRKKLMNPEQSGDN